MLIGEMLTADDVLWNWARWCWSGSPVGNMAHHIPEQEYTRPIFHDHAVKVDEMHKALPWHESMVITAEYPQKNQRFADMHAKQRMEAALRWIGATTGVWLREPEYKMYLGLFKDQVGKELL